MRHFTILLALFIISLSAASQESIRGIAIDSLSRKPVPKLSVTLLQGSASKGSSLTDSTGRFAIENRVAGTYSLQLTGAGYISKTIGLSTAANHPLLQLDTIFISPNNVQLANVTVTAQKALVEDKGDRLVYNASADISNAGGTAADVLRKVPTLSVDLNGNVQMRGNGNIKVLVNGKPSAMMARNLADALKQMPASIIRSVEVITSPGAKYDAEGAAGIINIITKKGLRGFNGSVNATAGDRNRSLGSSLSLKKGKIGLAFSGNVYQYRNIFESSSVRTALLNGVPTSILYRSSEGDNTGTGANGELAFDYDPDSTNHLNFSANVWGGDFPSGSTAHLRLTDAGGAVLQEFRNESHFTNPYGNGQLDLGWTKTFKKPEQEFSLLGQFSRMPDNYFYNTDRIATNEEIIFREKSTNYSRNKEYTFQADYTHPFSLRGAKDTTTLKLEIGSKAIIRDIGSEVRVAQSPNGKDDLVPDPSQSNDFDYIQQVYSTYTSLRWSNKKKWNVTAGARLEHTEINGHFVTTGTRLENRYNNLIPSVTVSKGVNNHTFKLSYTQRITRPLIWYLNPWVNRSDPKNISTGTPTLNPELNHAFEASHSFSKASGLSINTALYRRMTDNAIEYISRVDTGGVSVSQPLNIARRSALGLNINVSSKPTKNWDLNGGADLRYIEISNPAQDQENNGLVWNVNLNTTYRLPKEYTLQTHIGVYSGWISLQTVTTTIGYWYGLSAKKAFWEQKGSLTLGLNNPFHRAVRHVNQEEAPTFTGRSESFFVNRSVRLTFEWRFGQMSAGGKQGKKITNDDSGR